MDKEEMIKALGEAVDSMCAVLAYENLSQSQMLPLIKSADKLIDIVTALEGRPNANDPEPVPPNTSAFPVLMNTPTGLDCIDTGMRLLDYFAAKVMQGACANPDWAAESDAHLARRAYQRAYAMLKERNKGAEA